MFATLIVDLIGSSLVYGFEHGATGSEIATFGDSIFWTTCQLLTVSSQMTVPTSTGGRIVDVFLELYAITVVTTLAGSWGAFFHHQTRQRWGDQQHSA
jgi:mannose/fructose/N-acetylgalactosamine-specific phosphotransferase system component IID